MAAQGTSELEALVASTLGLKIDDDKVINDFLNNFNNLEMDCEWKVHS